MCPLSYANVNASSMQLPVAVVLTKIHLNSDAGMQSCADSIAASLHSVLIKIRQQDQISVCEIPMGISIRNPMKFSVSDENFGLARLLGCFFDFLCVFW
eukprot:COSAG05_NODE_75_length_21588_cov_303.091438_20_plen_99_part_00